VNNLYPRVLAIIPARKGSKRLPGKNMLTLGEKPLIRWTIDAAISCQEITEIVVTSDDDDIISLAISAGVKYVVNRPPELADDEAKSIDVVTHAIQQVEICNDNFDVICLLQPTSPLRNFNDISAAIELYFEKNAGSVISVCQLEHPIDWCNTIGDDLCMDGFIKSEESIRRSQECPLYYRLNGAIYIADKEAVLKSKSFFIKKSFAYIMPIERSIDIDNKHDFLMANILVHQLLGSI